MSSCYNMLSNGLILIGSDPNGPVYRFYKKTIGQVYIPDDNTDNIELHNFMSKFIKSLPAIKPAKSIPFDTDFLKRLNK